MAGAREYRHVVCRRDKQLNTLEDKGQRERAAHWDNLIRNIHTHMSSRLTCTIMTQLIRYTSPTCVYIHHACWYGCCTWYDSVYSAVQVKINWWQWHALRILNKCEQQQQHIIDFSPLHAIQLVCEATLMCL